MTLKDLKIVQQLKYSYEQLVSRLNIDRYVDRCMTRVRSLMEINFNPLLVEPIESSFDYGIWFFRFTANILLQDIKVHKLTDIKRTGIPSIKYEDRNVRMTWSMVFPELEITSHYDLKRKSGNSKRGKIKANITNLLADVDIRCDLEHLKAKLHNIRLNTERKIQVEIQEEIDLGENKLSFQRWRLGSTILRVVANVYKSNILKSVEKAVKESIEEALRGVDINE
ncbi:UNVERIFIED_CONTAM: hypothetical protein PYX00_002338 [Menopon gallinae]|uniref:Uncharacterized protein n=1 Tax=Menopon gallinae TaxID=328185 RepID=A0AAW2IGW2_9NEOP